MAASRTITLEGTLEGVWRALARLHAAQVRELRGRLRAAQERVDQLDALADRHRARAEALEAQLAAARAALALDDDQLEHLAQLAADRDLAPVARG